MENGKTQQYRKEETRYAQRLENRNSSLSRQAKALHKGKEDGVSIPTKEKQSERKRD
jgi:hypothetical protein